MNMFIADGDKLRRGQIYIRQFLLHDVLKLLEFRNAFGRIVLGLGRFQQLINLRILVMGDIGEWHTRTIVL